MRILQIVTNDARRGAPVFAVQLGRALEDMGEQVRTYALAPTTIDGARLDVPSIGAAPLHPRTLWRLSAMMRSADVVVAHGSRTLPACALAGVGAAPFVYRNIGDPDFWAGRPLRKLRVRAFYTRAAAVAALWAGSRDALEARFGVPARKLTVIPNGVQVEPLLTPGIERAELRRSLGLTPDAPTVGYVGALSPEKDVGTLLHAIPPGWQVVIAGDGPDRAELVAQAEALLPGRAAFLGMTSSPRAAFDTADIAALTSRSEGLPAVAIEAGVLGLPMVATDVGGVSSIIADGVTGRLVAPGDVEGVREALLATFAEREMLGPAAHQRCMERFAMSVVADRWRRLLHSVVAS